MARAAVSKKLTTKPRSTRPRLSRSVAKAVDLKSYGTEPVDISKLGDMSLTHALNWYNYMYEPDETREWLFDYMKKSGFSKTDIAAVRRVSKHQVSKTTCSLARILYNGNSLPETVMTNFNNSVQNAIRLGAQIKAEITESSSPVSVQDRTQSKIDALITECEEAIDTDRDLNIYDWLTGKEATTQAATAIRDHYARWIKDFEYVDEFATRTEKKRNAERVQYWTQFVHNCERYVGNKKVTKVRKPRVKKVKPAVDLVKKIQYQKEYPALKIVSVNPSDIIGCKQLWTYNTKYRKLSRYDAAGPNGIQVKGTTLIGFDAETSLTKSLRKPDITIQQLLSAGKVALRNMMTNIKAAESKPTGRINNDTILLRVIK
jgi:hypothetical protein